MLVPLLGLRAIMRPVTRHRSRRDIASHYDLGNDLFTRMLDPTLSYSCAVFEEPDMTLEEAQFAKLERICEKLALGPADHLLEIGTGWGALALLRGDGPAAAASRPRRSPASSTTTRSRRSSRRASQDRVTVLMRDYRDLAGHFDKLVSIEMIEAVGWRHFGRYFAKCSSLLAPGGMMLLQAITIDDRSYDVEKASRSFIKKHIFPGGSLPSLAVITRCLARRTDLQVLALEDITAHYVETLRRWRATFLANGARARRARLRRALPADLDAVSRLLRRRASRSGGSATSSSCC